MSLMIKKIDLPDEKLMEMFESDNHICIGGNYYPLMIKDVIQIPKDHGNIIDESKAVVTETIDGYYKITAPTILEAEE